MAPTQIKKAPCERAMYYNQATMNPMRSLPLLIISLLIVASLGCDAGLQPPEDEGTGTITGKISYLPPWPSSTEVKDLRFIAMRFIPQDTTDFFRLNEMVISERLPSGVEVHEFTLSDAPVGTYYYAGVAQKYADDLLAWRPVGLVETDGGTFFLSRGGLVEVNVIVDFNNPPVFPPQ
jgi:hypothetical protein